MKTIVADNDTRGPDKAMAKQKDIVGPDAPEAVHIPDLNHTVKNNNNGMYALTSTDPSFKAKTALNPLRIKKFQSDVTKNVKRYKPYIGDPVRRKECLDQFVAMVHHHCGNHTFCKIEEFCTYVEVKNEHPDWIPEEIEKESIRRSKRGGSYMDLSVTGIETLIKLISKRFNEKNIDKLAECGSSNACETFFSQLTMLSEGKRICGNGADLWLTFLKVCFCNNNGRDVERTYEDLSNLLNIEITETEKRAHENAQKRRKRSYEQLNSDEGKKRRKQARLYQALCISKDTNKSCHHRSEKKKGNSKPKAPSHCRNCGQVGHTSRLCTAPPPPKKLKVKLFDWNGIVRSQERHKPRLKRNQPMLFDWSKSSLCKN